MGKFQALFAMVMALSLSQAALSVAIRGDSVFASNSEIQLSALEKMVSIREGLSWTFYSKSCPSAETIVAQRVAEFLKRDKGVSAGLIRLMFHDCFVQGCDGSVLLKTSAGTEQDDLPNATLRKIALDLIDDAKALIEKACPGIVSCADVLILAGRESIKQVGGPAFNVPLGRRDSKSFSTDTSDLPGPTASFADQAAVFKRKNLTVVDLVALSGAHTLGRANCGSFDNRLRPTVDPKLNQQYASYLKGVCPTSSTSATSGLDFYTPEKFDNVYYKNFATGYTLLTSDQNLDSNTESFNLVKTYANDQTTFFNQFLWSYIQMSMVEPLKVGKDGEIRKVCSRPNSASFAEEDVISMVTDRPDSI